MPDPVNLTCLQGVTRATTQNPQDPDQGTGAGDADADHSRPMAASHSVDGVADTGWESLRGNYNQLRKLTQASREKLVRSCIDVYLKGNLTSSPRHPHDHPPQRTVGRSFNL